MTPPTRRDLAETTDDVDAVRFVDVHKSFGDLTAVNGVDLSIRDGEFFSLLGPSGSGKTTCLRMLGGFEPLTSGTIHLHGVDVSDLPPYRRDINTVFQDYALFPHMTVAANVAYGLMIEGVDKAERNRRVGDALSMVHLEGLGNRKPNQLSGGQRQRVALARALIKRPSVLLLDEPLGALDLQLRRSMQVELKALQRDVGITFVFVTHDQEEALTMSDRIAVMNHGEVAQVGSPSDLYNNPRSKFVATFVGHSNLIDEIVAQRLVGRAQPFIVRPERISLGTQETTNPEDIRLQGTVLECTFLGMYNHVRVLAAGHTELIAAVPNTAGDVELLGTPGSAVHISWPRDACRWIDASAA